MKKPGPYKPVGSYPQPTPPVQKYICDLISSGAFPRVAAEAAGVPGRVFDAWMRRGGKRGAKPIYRDFRLAIGQALGLARASAETKVFKEDLLAWLKSGPGRDTPAQPGWSNPVTVRKQPLREQDDALHMVVQMATMILELLNPYPDARIAVAHGLRKGMNLPLGKYVSPAPPESDQPETP